MKSKKGRPSKFDSCRDKILNMARFGMTEVQISKILDIDPSTLTKWKQKDPIFFTSLREQKYISDSLVERSLFERACGYEHDEIKLVSHEGVFSDERTIRKHYAPDPTSMIFWLKNRQPDRWRDKTEVDSNVRGALTVQVEKRTINSKKDIQRRVITKETPEGVETNINETITNTNFDINEVF